MIIGITGTRSLDQMMRKDHRLRLLRHYLIMNRTTLTELHHGDCVGVDEYAAHAATVTGICTVAHPPIDTKYRAHHKSVHIIAPREYLERNHDIVDACDFLLALPKDPDKEVVRSGTWATIRYARSINKETFIL